MKCCDHSLNAALQGLNGPFVIGLEIPCRACDGWWSYEQKSAATMWIRHDRVSDFVNREANPIATAAREKAYERILGRERNRDV
jgi:hypothetical protein